MRDHFPIGRRQAVIAGMALIGFVAGTAGRAAAKEAPRVAAEEVKRLAETGEVVIVDVRGIEAYDREHAEGALSIPLGELESRLAELPKDKLIAVYCTCTAEATSAYAAQQLMGKGYTKVGAIKGGLRAWKAAGGPTEVSRKPQ